MASPITVHDFGETQTYAFDFSEFLDAGESISSHTLSVTAGTATITAGTVVGETITFELSGGVPETEVEVTATIETSTGRTGIDRFPFFVSDAANLIPFGEVPVASPGGVWTLYTNACDDWESMSAAVTGRAAEVAVHWLWRLTGRRFGTRSTTIRPCLNPTRGSTYDSGQASPPGLLAGHRIYPVVVDGEVGNTSYACSTCSRIGSPTTLYLPYRVSAIANLTIAGETIPLSELAVLDNTVLVWQSPTNRTFPRDQDLTAPLGDPNTWGVTVTHGTPPPTDAKYALGVLACEIAKAQIGAPCALPRRVASIARQGVNIQLVSGDDFLASGLVGLTEVDQFIVSVNPSRLRQSPRILSPDDVMTRPSQTWTGA